ncbi:MAG: sulfatase-like hydrolase/transferase [Proteobacteria bacterium]|nr:sulfatase-like hydrolase/transferase [Pseudomonadota bacterium]
MATPEKTNIVFVLTDDQGVWAAGCYGNPEIRTPNIDRLAETGVRFENFFTTIPVCSASRASFLTGRIPSQHGVHDFISAKGDDKTFLDDEICYTDVLAEHGWTCGLSGKWHLGNAILAQHGFSHWFAHPHGAGQYNDQEMIRDGVKEVAKGYVTNAITDDALAFIDAKAKDDAPFYLSVNYTAPHSPWTGHPQDIVDSYDDCPFESCPQEEPHPWAIIPKKADPTQADSTTFGLSDNLGNRESLKGYFASITAMDLDVGRIVDRLEALGLRDNTLIVFAADNGYSCGHHGFWGKGNGTYPVNMYENSIKVPFVASHPGVIPEGIVQSAMVASHDFLPTLLEYVDLPLPDTHLPGRSFLPALKDEQAPGRDAVVIYDEYGYCRMIRTRDWKYVHRYYPDGPNELYDLVNDSDERRNLVDDPAQAQRIKELREQMEAWFKEYVIPDKDGIGFRAGAGQHRPVGEKWDDGTDAFVFGYVKKMEEKK